MARTDETPRDLLFGLLALHTGLIDQEQLLAAFGAWSRAKGKTLAEILVERGAIDAESRSILNAMAEKQLKLHGGDTEKSLAAVAAGLSTLEKLAALGDTDLTASVALVGSHTPSTDATATMSVGTSTSDGQRFRVLRPHAQGGLGAVFVALDGELNREVALKQILDHHADDPLSRTRFLIEAEITGGLEHPGIVPVYGLGHYRDGRPYYAMRFIRGDSLKDAIAAFHSDESLKQDPGKRSLALRKLLRRFVDVCNAIDYAHGRGVLHRDLKPGNVIVGKYGETLVVDWGLAKPMGRSEVSSQTEERTLMPSSASGSAETLPGSVIGTPAYMSPEQAIGDLERLGPRSDVYSLGATLYCLLIGLAPFNGTDFGAVLRAVQKGVFPGPRQVDASIDPALEAVCLRAMATKPEDRYASAKALADDVERWAAEEPVTAWREPMSRRARRWARRNRTAVTAAAVAVLVAVVGLAGVLAVQSRANARLEAKNEELDKANRLKDEANIGLVEANDRVQARFDLAREAIRMFQQGVNEDDMLKGEELKGLRNKLLRSAAGFYEKLDRLLQGQTDRASRAILAQSYSELGDLTEKIGIQPEALAVHRKALAIRRDLAVHPSADDGVKLDLARSLIAAGTLALSTGDSAGALSAYREARDLAGPRATGPGSTDAARDLLGYSHDRIAWVLSKTGKPAESLESYQQALAIRRALAEANPTVTSFRSRLADTYHNLGTLQQDTGKPAEALESFRQALAIYRGLAEANPAVNGFRESMAVTHNAIGSLLYQTDPVEGMESFRRSLAIMRELVEANPAVTRFRKVQAENQNNIGFLQLQAGRPAEALESHRQALAICRKLAEDNPTVVNFLASLSLSYTNIGVVHSESGRPAEALEAFARSLAIEKKLAEANPADTELRSSLALSYNNVGVLRQQAGQSAEALESLGRAVSIGRELVASNPANAEYEKYLVLFQTGHSDVLRLLGRLDEARDGYARAIEIGNRLVAANPEAILPRSFLGSAVLRLGLAKLAGGDLAGAVVDARRALTLFESLPSRSAYEWADLACVRSTLAGLAARGAPGTSADEAGPEADRAMDLLRRAVDDGYRDAAAIRIETALDPLRSRPDFQFLMMDLAFPADVFAR